jgi:hypothetical protein
MTTIEITDELVEIRNASDRADGVMAHLMCDGSVTLEGSGMPFLARPEQIEAFAAALQSLAARARKVAAGHERRTERDTGPH